MKQMDKKSRGFTLIELLIVMAIVAILGGVTVPMSVNFFTRDNFKNKTSEVLAQLRTAQMNSISGKSDSAWGVHISTSQIILFKGDTYASSDPAFNQSFDIPGDVTITQTSVIFAKITGVPNITPTITISTSTGDTQILTMNELGIVDAN